MILPSTEKPKPACWLKIEGRLLDAIYIVLVSLSFFFLFADADSNCIIQPLEVFLSF